MSRTSTALGNLRAGITLMVVLHHSLSAYSPRAPATPSFEGLGRWLGAPVVDGERWGGAPLILLFNDMFFMSLMFFLSGLFAWGSLTRKGSGRFLLDRAIRLGVPFLVSWFLLAPVAYYTAYVQSGGSDPAAFVRIWVERGTWPTGPAWFIAVLFAFDTVLTLVFLLKPHRLRFPHFRGADRPLVRFVALLVLSAAVYLPMTHFFEVRHWTMKGPFAFQSTRAFHYLLYFGLGVAIGARGIGRGWLSVDGRLARRWWSWLALAAAAGAFAVTASLRVRAGDAQWELPANLGFLLSCAASSFAMTALFLRFGDRRTKLWDSLRANAYGMYILHFIAVTWLQYALLRVPFPAFVKCFLVTAGAIAASWLASALLRRIPMVARVLDGPPVANKSAPPASVAATISAEPRRAR